MQKSQATGDILSRLTFEPLTSRNWHKFVELFGNKGACGNCWCMYFRVGKDEFNEGKFDEGNKEAMHRLVMKDLPTGILGFYDKQAIAWCAFAPRDHFAKLERSRVHKRIDNRQVWSIPCFFIDKNFRRMGLSVELLKGVINYAKQQGIKVIEAYPTIPTQDKIPDAFAWIGFYESFKQAGFEIVDNTSKNRPMVRYYTNK